MSELFNDENFSSKLKTCPAVGSQVATICLPVEISPHAVTGPAMIKCCGEPEVKPHCNHCRGTKNGKCEFTISQKIRVDIPVEFGASVDIGETFVECDCATADPKDWDCRCDKCDDD